MRPSRKVFVTEFSLMSCSSKESTFLLSEGDYNNDLRRQSAMKVKIHEYERTFQSFDTKSSISLRFAILVELGLTYEVFCWEVKYAILA